MSFTRSSAEPRIFLRRAESTSRLDDEMTALCRILKRNGFTRIELNVSPSVSFNVLIEFCAFLISNF